MYSATSAGTGLAESATAARFSAATPVGRDRRHQSAPLPMSPAVTASGRGNGDQAFEPSEPATVRKALSAMAATSTARGVGYRRSCASTRDHQDVIGSR